MQSNLKIHFCLNLTNFIRDVFSIRLKWNIAAFSLNKAKIFSKNSSRHLSIDLIVKTIQETFNLVSSLKSFES